MPAWLTGRVAGYLGAIAALAIAVWAIHHHGYTAGVDDERARYVAGLAAAGERYARQVEHDAQVNQESARANHDEIDRLRADLADRPLGPVRLCLAPLRAGEVPALPSLAGGAGVAGLAGGHGDGVREGAAEGPDIGPGLQRLAVAYDIRNAQVRALLERNRKLSEMVSAPR